MNVVVRIASLVLWLALACLGAPRPDLSSLAANGDWAQLAKEVESSTTAMSTESQMLRAHAAVALNDGNAGVCGFAALVTDSDRATWERWTSRLVAEHPSASAAHYLHGDGLARTADLAGAVREFDRAIALDSRNHLALSARGVVHTLLSQFDSALLDFVAALAVNPAFADAYVNRGFLYLRQKGSAVSGMKAFDAALKLTPRANMALLGKAQTLVALGRGVGAIADLDAINIPCKAWRDLVADDRNKLFTWIREESESKLALLANADVGTQLIDALKELGAKRDPAAAKKVIDIVSSTNDPTIRNKGTLALQSMEKTQPDMAKAIGQALTQKKVETEIQRGQLLKESSRTVELKAEIGGKLGKGGTGVEATTTAGAKADLKAYSAEQLKKLSVTEAGTKLLDAKLESGKAQTSGAQSDDLRLATMENGEAPRIYHNSLLYLGGIEVLK